MDPLIFVIPDLIRQILIQWCVFPGMMLWHFVIGSQTFLVIHIFDIIALKKIPAAKPLVWSAGCILFVYSLVMLCIQTGTLPLPSWSVWLGWFLFLISSGLFLYSLFVNLPFRKTYIHRGVGDKLIRTGLYALVRHPGVILLGIVLVSLVLISRSYIMLIAMPIFILLDILLVFMQDRIFFGRMFADYGDYRRETPMLLPNRHSINAFINSLKHART